MHCPYCEGEGIRILDGGFYREKCFYCDGQGEIWPNDEDGYDPSRDPCNYPENIR